MSGELYGRPSPALINPLFWSYWNRPTDLSDEDMEDIEEEDLIVEPIDQIDDPQDIQPEKRKDMWKFRGGKRTEVEKFRGGKRQNLWKFRGGKRAALWKFRGGKRADLWKFRGGKRNDGNYLYYVYVPLFLMYLNFYY